MQGDTGGYAPAAPAQASVPSYAGTETGRFYIEDVARQAREASVRMMLLHRRRDVLDAFVELLFLAERHGLARMKGPSEKFDRTLKEYLHTVNECQERGVLPRTELPFTTP